MTLLRDLANLFTKQPAERPPLTPTLPSGMVVTGGGAPSSTQALQAFSSTSALFSVINRIGDAVSSADWRLFRVQQNGERTEIERHAFLDLWDKPNGFTTRMEFLQTIQQHIDLTGEFWWIISAGEQGLELWPVRPDRMRPVPDREKVISGYVYKIGSDTIPLAVDQVVYQRMPNPLDWYRGIGPVGSLLIDLGAEEAAAMWTRNFFRNSAEPGGVIELDEELSDADFERMLSRWQQSHQGVSNAHRVAVLERGKWQERKFSMRDMQFRDLRLFNRDQIYQAFGVHKHIMGVAESVNRANALAAEEHFARWVVRPRLERIRGAVNEMLLPLFGEGLELDFIDPTPDDAEQNLEEAERGYNARFLTLNEARKRVGEPEVDGGDEFQEQPAAPEPFNLSVRTKQEDPLIEDPIEQAQTAARRAWERRLRDEAEALARFAEDFMDKGFGPVTKIELSDLDGYDWDWWSKYGDDVAAELSRIFTASLLAELPGMPAPQVQQLAGAYARDRGAELLRLDSSTSLVTQTRERVRTLVAETVEEGQSLRTLQRRLREAPEFSRRRAETVARTETRTALGQGQKQAALSQDRDEKRWITQGASDPRVEEICLANEAQGWIPIEQPFQSGKDTVPEHPNCMCTVIYRTSEVQASANGGRCPDCEAVLTVNIKGTGFYCRRCKKVIEEQSTNGKSILIERDDNQLIKRVRTE